MRIVIAGAGVIGLWCARELAGAGHDVTVVAPAHHRAESTPASAGWVVPVLAAPLSGPGLLGHTARQIATRQTAFSFRSLNPELAAWLWRFYRASEADAYDKGLKASLTLATGCLEAYHQLRADGLRFELRQDGLLMVARTKTGLADGRALAENAAAMGYQGASEQLDAAALHDLEPALAAGLTGGVHARDELHVDPGQLVQALYDDLSARGGTVLDASVGRLRPASSGNWSVDTSSGILTAERVVIAAGYWSKHIAATLGAPLPLQSAAGYSITATGTHPPHLPLKLIDANVAVTPLEHGVRLAGRFSLGRPPTTVSQHQLRRVVEAARPYFAEWRPERITATHVGLRPATPDSLPLIGTLPGRPGVLVATGHGMLGLTFAPGTAAEVLHQISTGEPSPIGAAFDPGRCAGHTRGARPTARTAR